MNRQVKFRSEPVAIPVTPCDGMSYSVFGSEMVIEIRLSPKKIVPRLRKKERSPR
jgi:hypothetical protein